MWTKERYEAYRQELFSLQDIQYRDFQEKLLCSALPVVGLRVPLLRAKAKEIAKADGEGFLGVCGRETYDERLLFGLVTAALPIPYADFLPYFHEYAGGIIENWAHCDVFCSSLKKVVAKNKEAVFSEAKKYTTSQNPWEVRTGLVLFLGYYLEEPYLSEVLEITDGISSDFYYIEMAQAWLLATAWAKDAEKARAFIVQSRCSNKVKAKFVQKACESFRVSKEDKLWLRQWKKETLGDR